MNVSADAGLLNSIDDALDQIPRSAGADLEITVVESASRTVAWADGKPNLNNASDSRGACVRALVSGGQGLATTTVPEPAAIRRVAEQALAAAAATARDSNRRLATPVKESLPVIPCDENLFQEPSDQILARLASIEKEILRRDPRIKKVVRMSLSEHTQSRAIGNSLGVRLSGRSTSAAFSIELLAVDGESTEAAWDYQASRFSSRLDPERIAREIAVEALKSLGGKSIPTKNYPLVLSPRVGAQLLGLVGQALSAEAVQKERSFLKGMIGKKVAAPSFTLADDPFLPEGLASESFDDEGVPHVSLTPIRDGALTGYFYDLRSATRDNVPSNGHASKGGLSAAPSPAATNLFVQSGASTLESMLSSDRQVFLIREVMGLHMADPITGEFSLGASGYLFEGGKFSHAVRGVTLAGSIGGLLSGIAGVATDLTWYGSIGAPSLLVTGLTVAGS